MKINNCLIVFEIVKGVHILHIGILGKDEKFVYNQYANYDIRDLFSVLYESIFIHDTERIVIMNLASHIKENLIQYGKMCGMTHIIAQEQEIVYVEENMRKEKLWKQTGKIEWKEKKREVYNKLKELQNL